MMISEQPSNRENLRDLVVTLEEHQAKQYHLGLDHEPISRTIPATANQNRNYKISENFASCMIKKVCKKQTPNAPDIFGENMNLIQQRPRYVLQHFHGKIQTQERRSESSCFI